MKDANHICPASKAGLLDNKLRKWLQNPRKILRPYVKEGMTVLDLGCGPGFFSLELARLVGSSGQVIASDLQEAMLKKVESKIEKTELKKIIKIHKCEEGRIALTRKVDFILAFYMVHEVPYKIEFFNELKSLLSPQGVLFIVEPAFHVSRKIFARMIKKAKIVGFQEIKKPKIFLSRSVILSLP